MQKITVSFGVLNRFREPGVCGRVSVKSNDSVCDGEESGTGCGFVVLGYI